MEVELPGTSNKEQSGEHIIESHLSSGGETHHVYYPSPLYFTGLSLQDPASYSSMNLIPLLLSKL